jgi:hypothetical protein
MLSSEVWGCVVQYELNDFDLLLASYLAYLSLWKWRKYVSPKRQWTSTGLHSQIVENNTKLYPLRYPQIEFIRNLKTYLLVYNAMLSVERQPTFRRNMPPLSSGSVINQSRNQWQVSSFAYTSPLMIESPLWGPQIFRRNTVIRKKLSIFNINNGL